MTVFRSPTEVCLAKSTKYGRAVGSGSPRAEMYFWVALAGLIPVYRYATSLGLSFLPLLVVLALLYSLGVGHTRRRSGSFVWVVSSVLILLASLFSGIATDVSDTLRVGIPFALIVGLAPGVLAYHSNIHPDFIRKTVHSFLLVQSISAIAGLLQLGGIFISSREFRGRATGLADHPNVLGLMSAIGILICLGLIFSQTPPASRLLNVGFLTLNGLALMFSGSLSSILALSAGLLVLLVSAKGLSRIVVPVVTLFMTASAIAGLAGVSPFGIFGPVLHRVAVVTGQSEGVASLDIREETYSFALASIPAKPITGVGMDSLNEGTYNGVTVVHNYLLRGFYQGGIFLFIALLIISILIAFLVVQSSISGKGTVAAAIASGVLMYALTSAFYDQQQYWFLIFFAVAAIQSTERLSEESRPSLS